MRPTLRRKCGLALLLACACSRGRESGRDEAERGRVREEKNVAPSPTVTLSPEARQAAGIRVVGAAGQEFEPRLDAPGVIRADAQRSVDVRAPLAGRLTRVLVDVGTRVHRGAPLAALTGPEVTAAVARHRGATARAGAAARSLERADRLLALQAISRAERENRAAESEAASAEAAAASQDLGTLGIQATDPSLAEVPSPLSGVVLARSASPGLQVERDAPLFVIADLASVWAVADVYDKDLAEVARDGDAEVRTDAYPEVVFRGPVALVGPEVDEASKMSHVRVVLDNRDGRLRPGLLVTVSLPLRSGAGGHVIAVPAAAVQRLSGLTAVFVETTPGRFELRTVETGRDHRGVVEVRAGLHEGESVVVEGTFYLKGELLKHTLTGEEEEEQTDGKQGKKKETGEGKR